jgi:cytochrome oxidase Cu insertion factor (SCO1/SenC/PrrC family)
MKFTAHHPDRPRAVATLGLAALLSISITGLSLAAAEDSAPPKNSQAELKAGMTAPDFTLLDTAGEAHHLAALKGKQPVVLVFYRGTW